MRGKVWKDLENLHPRVGMGLGATIPLPGYSNVKPSVSLEIDVPDGASVDETFDMLEKVLTKKFHELATLLEAEVENR